MGLPNDPVDQAGLTRRSVRKGRRNGQLTKVVVAERTYRADRTDLWEALTDPERLPRWFLPIRGDLRVGGSYQLEGNAGGTIEQCRDGELIAVTWEFGGGVSWLEVELSESANGTVLELRHEAPVDDHWKRFGPGAVGVGWDLSLRALDLHLGSGEALDPAAYEAWTVSDEGKGYIRAASEGWGVADADGGADPAAARSAAEETRAFFTGESSFSWEPDAD